MEKNRTLEDKLLIAGVVILAVGTMLGLLWHYYLYRFVELPACIWDKYMHIYCPGCGGTRSFLALMRGEVLLSLWYHPLVPYAAAMYLCFMLRGVAGKLSGGRIRGMRFHTWYLYLALGIVMVNLVVKNLLRLVWNIEMF